MNEANRRWTVGELLAWTAGRFERAGIEDARLDAEHLLARALGCQRIELYVQHERLIGPAERAGFRDRVKRRLEREPVAYIEGVRGFHALDIELAVDPRVLIPRPETEHLVDWIVEDLEEAGTQSGHVVDVGTGSGAIALALARARPQLDIVASDVSAAALEVARANAANLGLDVRFVESDLLRAVPIPEGGFDVIAANLPYVTQQEWEALAPEVRDHEPRLALVGGADGLDLIRALVAQIAERTAGAPGCRLYLEFGQGQGEAVEGLLREAGWSELATRTDLAGIDRVIAASRP